MSRIAQHLFPTEHVFISSMLIFECMLCLLSFLLVENPLLSPQAFELVFFFLEFFTTYIFVLMKIALRHIKKIIP